MDVYWHHVLDAEIDPGRRLAERAKQKMYLARYARQPWGEFDDRPVEDIDEALAALNEVMRDESGLGRVVEDM